MAGINLDAILNEGEPKPLTYKGVEFTLPGELPADVLAPFLAEDLGLIELIGEVLVDSQGEKKVQINPENGLPLEDDDDGFWDSLVKVLSTRQTLPRELINAIKTAFTELLDIEQEGQAAAFFALRPSVRAYPALIGALAEEYGFGLTDFFGSVVPSQGPADGEESKPTSSASTAELSTSEASGVTAPVIPISSE